MLVNGDVSEGAFFLHRTFPLTNPVAVRVLLFTSQQMLFLLAFVRSCRLSIIVRAVPAARVRVASILHLLPGGGG